MSKFIAEAGIITSFIGLLIVLSINIYGSWLLLKARNRFKRHQISTLDDLSVILYGE